MYSESQNVFVNRNLISMCGSEPVNWFNCISNKKNQIREDFEYFLIKGVKCMWSQSLLHYIISNNKKESSFTNFECKPGT